MMLSNQGQAIIRHIKLPLDQGNQVKQASQVIHSNQVTQSNHLSEDSDSPLSLNLDWLTGQVMIMPNPHNEIEIIQYADTGFKIEKAFQYELHTPSTFACDSQVEIKGEDHVMMIPKTKHSDPIVITITDGRKSTKLGVNLKKTCLEIFVPTMLLSNLNIKGVGTQIMLSEMNAEKVQCNVVSGKLQLSGAYEKLQLHATGSNVDAQLCEVKELTVKSTSSKLRVCIPKELRFTISTGKLTSLKAIRSAFPLQYENSQLKSKGDESRFHVSIAGGHMEIVPL